MMSHSHHEIMLEIMSAIHGILKEILEAVDQRDDRHNYGRSAQLQSQHLKNVEHDVRGTESQILMKIEKKDKRKPHARGESSPCSRRKL